MIRANQPQVTSTFQALSSIPNTDTELKLRFRNFLKEFSMMGQQIYNLRIQEHIGMRKNYLPIELMHLKVFDEAIYESLREEPEEWVKKFQSILTQYAKVKGSADKWQLQLVSEENAVRLREIHSGMANKLFVTSGIVVKATRPYIKGTQLVVQCSRCEYRIRIPCSVGQAPQIPRMCINSKREFEPCGMDSLRIIGQESKVQNYQKVILEEYPEHIPKGQTPRSSELVLDRYNAAVLTPGERVTVTAVMLLKQKDRGIRAGYLWALGVIRHRHIQELNFSPEEELNFKKFSKDSRLHERIFGSIAPKIFGCKDIKEAVACQLFGGSRKVLPDNTRLRGDINVLLVGDPSTAKSQFLIFAQKMSTISVYTSGKGSSAAGLTASINKDPLTGEFQIEAGALVRADGGLVCIDQFDKMRPEDRVAIHEAMQQQTISVAKAGITSRLNSRCSILAAANPVLGRYDNFKQITEQINLMTTILSRFDCIFVVRDQKDSDHDAEMVSHVLDLHINRTTESKETDENLQFMRRYIAYSRQKINPRLTSEAASVLKRCFVEDRKESAQHRAQAKQSIPVTVRQLQAIIRLSEVICQPVFSTHRHVNEAHRLFQSSTLSSIRMAEVRPPKEMGEQILKVQEIIKRRVPLQSEISIKKLADELKDQFSEALIQYAINNLVHNGNFKQINRGSKLQRQQ